MLSQLEVVPDCHTELVHPPCHQPALAGTAGKKEDWKTQGWATASTCRALAAAASAPGPLGSGLPWGECPSGLRP